MFVMTNAAVSKSFASGLDEMKMQRRISFNRGWKFIKYDTDDKELEGAVSIQSRMKNSRKAIYRPSFR